MATTIEVLLAVVVVLLAVAVWGMWRLVRTLAVLEGLLARLAQATEGNLAAVERFQAERARQMSIEASLRNAIRRTVVH